MVISEEKVFWCYVGPTCEHPLSDFFVLPPAVYLGDYSAHFHREECPQLLGFRMITHQHVGPTT